MKVDIEKALKQATDLPSFIKLMQQQGYKIEKGRGISFIDDKGMRVKGSELGYSLRTIERQIAQGRYRDKELFQMAERDITQTSPAISAPSLLETFLDQGSIIGDLLKSEEEIDTLPYDLEALKRKKKKRKGPRL